MNAVVHFGICSSPLSVITPWGVRYSPLERGIPDTAETIIFSIILPTQIYVFDDAVCHMKGMAHVYLLPKLIADRTSGYAGRWV